MQKAFPCHVTVPSMYVLTTGKSFYTTVQYTARCHYTCNTVWYNIVLYTALLWLNVHINQFKANKRHPIAQPYRRAIGCLSWGFGRKLTTLERHHTVIWYRVKHDKKNVRNWSDFQLTKDSQNLTPLGWAIGCLFWKCVIKGLDCGLRMKDTCICSKWNYNCLKKSSSWVQNIHSLLIRKKLPAWSLDWKQIT